LQRLYSDRRPAAPIKTDGQLDLQAHRVRSRLISERTAVINQIRSFLLERGIPVRQGLRFLRQQLPEILGKRVDVLSTPRGQDNRALESRLATPRQTYRLCHG
jgi:hypothetical protein